MSIGKFTFQDYAPGQVFIQIDGEGGVFNWIDVPAVVKALLFNRENGLPYDPEKEKEAIVAMRWFWGKYF